MQTLHMPCHCALKWIEVHGAGAHVAAAATVVASKLNVAAKEWVPPGTPSVAAPAANESNIRYQQHANDFQYNGWGGDGSYDANSNGYDYGYAGWQGGETNGSNWGAPGEPSDPPSIALFAAGWLTCVH